MRKLKHRVQWAAEPAVGPEIQALIYYTLLPLVAFSGGSEIKASASNAGDPG